MTSRRSDRFAHAVVCKVPFTEHDLAEFVVEQRAATGRDARERSKLLLDYPTVYVVHQPSGDRYRVYVGETTDIRSRTVQHLRADIKHREDWKELAEHEHTSMYVIGHPLFNKSLTLDIENQLMHWLSGVDAVEQLHNRRTNVQNDYHTRESLDRTFEEVWSELRRHDKKLFPTETLVQQSALFKASPFHKLTRQQLDAKARIEDAIYESLRSGATQQLVLVQGAAGSGKTVLLSSLFYELFQASDAADPDPFDFQDLDAYLLVNHVEQLTVYEQIATKLGLIRKNEKRVSRPTTFINHHSPDTPVDVVLVDEAHLLWTQGKQSYQGTNQLRDLVERAKVVVAVFDPDQVLATNQYWEGANRAWLDSATRTTITLDQQMRIASSPETLRWIRRLIDQGEVGPMPHDPDYDLRVFDDPSALHEAIRTKAGSVERGLSRLVATFDWPYSSARRPDDGGTWNVRIGDFVVPWNLQIEYSRADRRRDKGLSWAERAGSVEEVGSHFTVQGFDLNYAGVIIGPSVRFRDGRIVRDPSASANTNATQKRSMSDGSKGSVAEDLLRNELNVLLTRGVNGLYIYAVDDELRAALLRAQAARGSDG